MTVNLSTQDPKWAWHEMTETYWAQGALKAASGIDQRGRKNTKPVFHYSLSWAESDNPTPEQMQHAALSSLKALGLGEHEALIAAHTDTKHPHVHIVVNTVHPQTGRTADLKFTKLELSRWAERYEREHSIHCEDRIKNNAEREKERAAKRRTMDAASLLMGQRHDASRLLNAASELSQRRRTPRPPRQRSDNRRRWLEKKDVVDRMKRLRAEQEIFHKIDRNNSWDRHRTERNDLWQNTRGAINQANDYVSKKFKPQWRELYKLQRDEFKFAERATPLERAIFVFKNSERLGNGKALKARDKHAAIRSPGRLLDLLDATHARERAWLAQVQKVDAHQYTGKILDDYARRHDALLSRQSDERQAERLEQFIKSRKITFNDAKESLLRDIEAKSQPVPQRPFKQPPPPEPARAPEPPEPIREPEPPAPAEKPKPELSQTFDKATDPTPQLAPEPELPRSEQLKRLMEEWKKKNPGRDFGREI